jgi:CD109 antigen
VSYSEILLLQVSTCPNIVFIGSGDIIGPLPANLPCSMSKLMGKDGKGTADRIFDLASNVWTLHYLRLTNQLDGAKAREVFVEMNKLYAWIMKRFSLPGFFRMWNLSSPSVWSVKELQINFFKLSKCTYTASDDLTIGISRDFRLSSWALQIFQYASFQDWENHFFVEQGVFLRVVNWLIQFQNLDGSFSETVWYHEYPVNKRMGYMVKYNLSSCHVMNDTKVKSLYCESSNGPINFNYFV